MGLGRVVQWGGGTGKERFDPGFLSFENEDSRGSHKGDASSCSSPKRDKTD